MTDGRPLTPHQRRALRWLAAHGGHATLDRYGRAVTKDGDVSATAPAIWVRLWLAGYICKSFIPDHFGLTIDGANGAHS